MALTLVTTLPPRAMGAEALRFAHEAWLAGAEALEVRSDLHAPEAIDARRLADIIPLMVSERGAPVPASWRDAARFIDREIGARDAGLPSGSGSIASHHAAAPMQPARALELWVRAAVPSAVSIKHVEPLGPLGRAARLLDTQRLLIDAFGAGRVTVLATGVMALPFRCLLAPRNAYDYVEFGNWAAAEGQRLLGDAVHDRRASIPPRARRGILGSRIAHSRSPRAHAPPFDRIDVPPDTDVAALLSALLPHYDGLAVTSPFKKQVAQATGAQVPAVNTLVRQRGEAELHWTGFNTDPAGARIALQRFGEGAVQVLGDGGATSAIREACHETGRDFTVHRRDSLPDRPLSGRALWTWPAHLPAPEQLSFRECTVGLIAYGEPARHIRAAIRQRGGAPLALGAAWFAAQARGQRQLWETAQ
jgi:hypothetical protein